MRYIFFTLNQERGEPVESFVIDLMLKAKTCEFQTLRDSLNKDCIVLVNGLENAYFARMT